MTNVGFFLDEMISHNQLPLNLIFISELPGFGFYEAIFRLFVSKNKRKKPKPGCSEINIKFRGIWL
jgi:hypothetical protein